MTKSLSVLILSQDSNFFRSNGVVPSDTRRRHIRYASTLRTRFPDSQIRVVAFTRHGTDTQYERVSDGLELFGTCSRHRATYLLDLRQTLARFHKQGWRPDLVTAQTPWEESLVGLAFARYWGAPFLAQFHSDFYGAGFRGERFINLVLRWISRLLARRSDHIRAVSSGIRDSILAAGDSKSDRISIIPVPVDFTPEVSSERTGTSATPPVVLFVGRLVQQKDLQLWLNVAARVAGALPEARFVIAGDGPEKAALEAHAHALGLRIEFLGNVDHLALPHLYAQSSVLLLTSLHEGLGRVIVEAMLAGVPVVSSDIVGPRDLIVHGQTGWLVPERSPGPLAQAVINALIEPEKTKVIAAAANAWAKEHYAFESVTEQLTALWARVAAARP